MADHQGFSRAVRQGGGRASARGRGRQARASEVSGGDLPEEAPEERAREICLRLLSAGPRTRAQLADSLHRKGIPGEAAETVLGRFAEVGLIDDAGFARAWVETRHYSRGLAGRALEAELRRRGVAEEDVRAATGLLGPDEELATARRLAERRVAATRGQPEPARSRRLAGFLARKGYPAPLVYRVIREALEHEGRGPDAAGVLDFDASDDW